MINSYSVITQTPITGGVLTFATDSIKTGCGVCHAEGTSTFTLSKPGYYYITFNGSAATTGGAAGDITVQLYNGDIMVPGAISTGTSADTTTMVPLKFSTIIKVNPSCCAVCNKAVLTVRNTGVGASFDNVNLTINRLA